jgi:hypothetical protein
MNDDDTWDTILGNAGSPWNPAGIGGDSITPLLLPRLQDTVQDFSPPPGSPPPINLSSWSQTGLGGDTLAMLLPQLQDTSATFLSPSSLQPPSALYDPNPPQLTVDQLATMYGMSPQQIAAIREQAKDQFRAEETIGDGAVVLTDAAAPEWGILASGVAAGKRYCQAEIW